MQIYLKFRSRDVVLPLANKYHFQSLIYSMLSADKSYSEFLHNNGYTFGNKHFKLFTFGNPCGKYIISGKKIIYPDGFVLQLRSPDMNFINAILRALALKKEYTLCGNNLFLDDFSLENETVTDDRITVNMLSPITVYTSFADGATLYYSPFDTEFYELVRNNAQSKLSAINLTAENFNIYPFEGYEYTEKNKMVTTYKNTYITAWSGKFILEGEQKVLDYLYNAGIGSKNSQGFGMFEVLNKNK